jgi:hypothetical protein
MKIEFEVFEKDGEIPGDILETLQGLKRGIKGHSNKFPIVVVCDKKKGLTGHFFFSSDVKRIEKTDADKESLNAQLLNLTERQKL